MEVWRAKVRVIVAHAQCLNVRVEQMFQAFWNRLQVATIANFWVLGSEMSATLIMVGIATFWLPWH